MVAFKPSSIFIKYNAPINISGHERQQGIQFLWSLLKNKLQLSRNNGTRLGSVLRIHFTAKLRLKQKKLGIQSRMWMLWVLMIHECFLTNHCFHSRWNYYSKQYQKSRQQITKLIKASPLVPVVFSVLKNKTPVFLSSHGGKWFCESLCPSLWIVWFYCHLVCFVKWNCNMNKYFLKRLLF